MDPSARGLVMSGLLLAVAFAGCTDTPEAKELLRENVEVGEQLFSFGDQPFHPPGSAGNSKRIRGTFNVTNDIGTIGVSFIGSFAWTNSTATLTILDSRGNTELFLNATAGLEDDHGTIQSFFTFSRLLRLGPGTYEIIAAGSGKVDELHFKVLGIPDRQVPVVLQWHVSDDAGSVRVRLFLLGLGSTPTATVRGPDGVDRTLELDGPDDDGLLTYRATKGAHELRVVPGGWAGRLVVEVEQRP